MNIVRTMLSESKCQDSFTLMLTHDHKSDDITITKLLDYYSPTAHVTCEKMGYTHMNTYVGLAQV